MLRSKDIGIKIQTLRQGIERTVAANHRQIAASQAGTMQEDYQGFAHHGLEQVAFFALDAIDDKRGYHSTIGRCNDRRYVEPEVISIFHCAAFYRNGETLRGEASPDLAEIDSQGLELLTVLRYDTIYGEWEDAARTAELYLSLYTLVCGCLEDEFQRFAYAAEDPTVEALNAEYGRLIGEYGLVGLGAEARSWTQIPQTFRSPLYEIGYAAAMSAAMELYRAGRTDAAAAADAYLSIVDRRAGSTFRKTLLRTGLTDPFGSEWEERFSETLDAIFPR